MAVESMPAVNAFLNGTAAVLLALGLIFIRQRRIEAHRFCMLAAFATSLIFLGGYLWYHFQIGGSKHYDGTGILRTTYLSILLTHTVLAATVPFLAVVTLLRGLKRQDDRHRAIARWTLPIWMYVSVTGVVIYLMLYVLPH